MTTVTLTFDDALDSHLDRAVPILEARGLRATFFVPLRTGCLTSRHEEWRRAAAEGHELGNHTIFHPAVATKSWVTEGIALEHYTLDRMREELLVANRVLTMVDGKRERPFAFPCSNPHLGHAGWAERALVHNGLERTRLMDWASRAGLQAGSRRIDYTPLVREIFPAARCGSSPIAELPRLPRDRHRVVAVQADGASAEDLLAIVDSAVARDCWLVLVFHAIEPRNGEPNQLACDPIALERVADRLTRDDVRVQTFATAARELLG